MNPLLMSRLTECLEVVKAQGLTKSPQWHYRFELEFGSRFLKVAIASALHLEHLHNAPRSVFFFVEKETGDVYKAAGWKAPAKGIRYRLADDASFQEMKARIDPYSSFLYKR